MKDLLTAFKNFWFVLFPKKTFTSVSEYLTTLREAINNGQTLRIVDLLHNEQWNWEEMTEEVRQEKEELFQQGEDDILQAVSW